ncbi:terminase small subunit [Desulfogranum marinum]|uniref:terminase small subunit n=1 Tax=Desulfogranum marinum TaxID=453220 RepID=UPI0029C95ACE|nr:terminase small subunit [Desulfogranum marinum]
MIVNRKELADIFGVANTTIDAWVSKGCPVIEKGTRGKASKYDTVDVFNWLKHDGNEDIDLQKERALLAAEQRRKIQRENDIAEGLVAPVSLLYDALEKTAAQIIPIFESLPLMMKRNWPEITGDQITLVKKAIAECRNAVADAEVNLDG